MDGLPEQPIPPQPPASSLTSSERRLPKNILKIVGVILILGSVVLLLNYFGIIPLSRFFPFLSYLTPAAIQQPNQTSTSQPITLSLPCPVSPEFCQQGQRIESQEEFIGIGFNLPAESKIFAVSDGPAVFSGVEDKEKGILNHAKINITGNNDTYTYNVIYEYYGIPKESIPAKNVNSGDELGTLLGGNFPNSPPYNGINFLIYVLSARTSDGTSYQVNNINFIQ